MEFFSKVKSLKLDLLERFFMRFIKANIPVGKRRCFKVKSCIWDTCTEFYNKYIALLLFTDIIRFLLNVKNSLQT